MTTPTALSRRHHTMICLLALFLLALAPRFYGALTVGWNWWAPGSFTLVNFDEGGSCRAALDGFDYSTFIGRQTIALATLVGVGPDANIAGDAAAVKAYCHSPAHIVVARAFSAVCGALTVVVLAVIALLLVPARPAVAWTAGALLALSGFHLAQSHSGTVDAPSVFYIHVFFAVLIYAATRNSARALHWSPLLLAAAIWAKYWVFALGSYLAFVPRTVWRYVSAGMSAPRQAAVVIATALLFGLLSNTAFRQAGLYPWLALYYLVIPWRRIARGMVLFWLAVPILAWSVCEIDLVATYTRGDLTGRFGSSYGAIGWHKLVRNLLNLPVLLLVGLGIPACLFIPAGLRVVVADQGQRRGWLCLTPVLLFALYMALVAPVTYYRHYLPLLPTAALLAALGLYATRWSGCPWFMVAFFVWPALLAVDMEQDYQQDPRRALPAWYAGHEGARILSSFYVNPPPAMARSSRLFRPEYAVGEAGPLRWADYLVLSENWYDTAFANELNGPLVDDLSQLIKTTPAHARFYRDTLAGRQPHLRAEQAFVVHNFMPELMLHKKFYGTFQMFVGDVRIFRIVP